MMKFLLAAALLATSPAFAAVECNSLPGQGDYRIRFSTEKSDYGITKLHQDWIEKDSGKALRKSSTVLRMSASAEKLAIRTVPNTENSYKHLSYIEIVGTPFATYFNASATWWSLRVPEGSLLPKWLAEGKTDLICIVD